MSSVWISLSLLYLLQHSVSSDEAVLLTCPKTVSVKPGDTVTETCSIKWETNGSCNVTNSLIHTNGTTTECGSTSETYRCAWDNSNVKLVIAGVKEDNITVEIQSNCGLASEVIHVHLSVVDMTATPALNQREKEKETLSYLISSILGVLATVIVVAVLSCLIRKTLLDGHWSDGGTSTDLKPGLLTLCEPIAKAAAGGSFVY